MRNDGDSGIGVAGCDRHVAQSHWAGFAQEPRHPLRLGRVHHAQPLAVVQADFAGFALDGLVCRVNVGRQVGHFCQGRVAAVLDPDRADQKGQRVHAFARLWTGPRRSRPGSGRSSCLRR